MPPPLRPLVRVPATGVVRRGDVERAAEAERRAADGVGRAGDGVGRAGDGGAADRAPWATLGSAEGPVRCRGSPAPRRCSGLARRGSVVARRAGGRAGSTVERLPSGADARPIGGRRGAGVARRAPAVALRADGGAGASSVVWSVPAGRRASIRRVGSARRDGSIRRMGSVRWVGSVYRAATGAGAGAGAGAGVGVAGAVEASIRGGVSGRRERLRDALDGFTALRLPGAETGTAADEGRSEPLVVPVREVVRLAARWFATKRCPYVVCVTQRHTITDESWHGRGGQLTLWTRSHEPKLGSRHFPVADPRMPARHHRSLSFSRCLSSFSVPLTAQPSRRHGEATPGLVGCTTGVLHRSHRLSGGPGRGVGYSAAERCSSPVAAARLAAQARHSARWWQF